jgi:hypothetical protein
MVKAYSFKCKKMIDINCNTNLITRKLPNGNTVSIICGNNKTINAGKLCTIIANSRGRCSKPKVKKVLRVKRKTPTVCNEGLEYNIKTGRCRKIKLPVYGPANLPRVKRKTPRVKRKTPRVCNEGLEYNIKTGRCRKIKLPVYGPANLPRVKRKTPRVCKDGQEYNIKTGRCWKLPVYGPANLPRVKRKTPMVCRDGLFYDIYTGTCMND